MKCRLKKRAVEVEIAEAELAEAVVVKKGKMITKNSFL
jgi:hypothetical protein